MISFVPPWFWATACAALVATNCVSTIRVEGLQKKSATDKVTIDGLSRSLMQSEEMRSRERDAALAMTDIQRKANDEKMDLQRRVAVLNERLRNRPERPATDPVPESAADPVACTGASLYRPDAEFLIGEAARADQLRVDLQACQAAYDQAVELTH